MEFITKVDFDEVVVDESFKNYPVQTMLGWFAAQNKLEDFNFLKDFRMDQCKDLYYLFAQNKSIRSFNANLLTNTADLRRIGFMFFECPNLVSVDFSDLNTAMLGVGDKLEVDMTAVFYYDSSLESVSFGDSFCTENIKSFSAMFLECRRLKDLDLNTFSVENLEEADGMFFDCVALTKITCDNDWNSSVKKDVYSYSMFYDCRNLVGGIDTTYNLDFTDITYARPDGGSGSETPGYFSSTLKPITNSTLTSGNIDENSIAEDAAASSSQASDNSYLYFEPSEQEAANVKDNDSAIVMPEDPAATVNGSQSMDQDNCTTETCESAVFDVGQVLLSIVHAGQSLLSLIF